MKLVDVHHTYYEVSSKASDAARTLAWSALGVIWVFKNSANDTIDDTLVLPGLLLVLALAANLLHYLSDAIVWSLYGRHIEKRFRGKDHEFRAPASVNIPTLSFYYGKLILVASAYLMLVSHLIERVVPH